MDHNNAFGVFNESCAMLAKLAVQAGPQPTSTQLEIMTNCMAVMFKSLAVTLKQLNRDPAALLADLDGTPDSLARLREALKPTNN